MRRLLDVGDGTRSRSLRALLLVAMAGATSCTGGRATPPSPSRSAPGPSSPAPSGIVETTLPNGAEKTLQLSPGPQEVDYAIQALDPPTHTYSVRLVASSWPDLTVWVDADVLLLVTSGTQQDESCRKLKGRALCRWDYPALEARKPGTWTVHVLKTTAAPSVVRITVRFEPLG